MKEAEEIETVGVAFERVIAVAPGEASHIRVTLEGRSEISVDLGSAIKRLKIDAPLRDDRALFESVHLVSDSVIGWGDDDAIDMHASAIERLAAEAAPARSEDQILSAR